MTVTKDYDREFFTMHAQWRCEYAFIADSFHRHLKFQSVIDLGCGNGYMILRLNRYGKTITGVDGSMHARKYFPHLRLMDLTQPIELGTFDLVICTEVAEHIEENKSDALLDNIIKCSKDLIVFSAAQPGAGGHKHVNEQPAEYWVKRFNDRGFYVEQQKTQDIRSDLDYWIVMAWWFTKNILVLRRGET